jgi:hypothetical protein
MGLALLICIIITSTAWAAPASETAIPVFAGASRDTVMEEEQKTALPASLGDSRYPLESSYIRVYKTTAPIEEVFRFYQSKLGGNQGDDTTNPIDLAPNSDSGIFYTLGFYTYHPSGKIYFAQRDILPLLKKNRVAYEPGQWLRESMFSWSRKEANNKIQTFTVTIGDRCFTDSTIYTPYTEILIIRCTFASGKDE